MRIFQDDDAGYLTWLETHSNGLVVNTYRRPRPSYLKLHQADCGTITKKPANGDRWTVDYVKVCAEHRAELDAWAWHSVGGVLKACKICHPDLILHDTLTDQVA